MNDVMLVLGISVGVAALIMSGWVSGYKDGYSKCKLDFYDGKWGR